MKRTDYIDHRLRPLALWPMVCLLLWGGGPLFAQSNPVEEYRTEDLHPRPFDRTIYTKTIEGLDYSTGKARAKPAKESPPPTADDNRDQEENRGSGIGDWQLESPLLILLVKGLLILAAAFFLFILLRALLGLEWTPRKKKTVPASAADIELEKIEENLEVADLKAYIDQAVREGRYRLAVRLYYLQILKELSAAKLIRWRLEKTNRDYLRELQGDVLSEEMDGLTQAFETIWYGNRSFGKAGYRLLSGRFERFVHHVRNRRSTTNSTEE